MVAIARPIEEKISFPMAPALGVSEIFRVLEDLTRPEHVARWQPSIGRTSTGADGIPVSFSLDLLGVAVVVGLRPSASQTQKLEFGVALGESFHTGKICGQLYQKLVSAWKASKNPDLAPGGAEALSGYFLLKERAPHFINRFAQAEAGTRLMTTEGGFRILTDQHLQHEVHYLAQVPDSQAVCIVSRTPGKAQYMGHRPLEYSARVFAQVGETTTFIEFPPDQAEQLFTAIQSRESGLAFRPPAASLSP